MSNPVDILIHLHPELDPEDQTRLMKAVMGQVGVKSANFDQHSPPHALQVFYDPDVVSSSQILELVRQHDLVASMIGL